MKKCKGCGAILQYTDINGEGYSLNESFDYCQRCFRLNHYGDIKGFKKSFNENNTIINSYKELEDCLFVVVMDALDAFIIGQDKFLDNFIDRDVLLVINKIDLLPRSIKDDKVNDLFINCLDSYKNNKNISCLLTYKNDDSFNDLFFELLNEKGYKKVCFVGRVNAGKSTLINKLCKDVSLTTSIYPGTTINFNEIKFKDYTFVDTPGLLDEESFVSYLDNKLLKQILPLKTIKPTSFQLYENQSYSIEGLVSIDIKVKGHASVIFFINNNMDVHRTKLENVNRYFEKNVNSFKLKLLPLKDNKFHVSKYKTFYLKGLGIFKVKGNCEVNVRVNDKIKVYCNEVNL